MEAILAGLAVDGDDIVKPHQKDTGSVPLRLGKKAEAKATTSALGTGAVTLNLNGKRKNGPTDISQPPGVGFVNFDDDFNELDLDADDSDDELIDENTLLDEEDMKRPVVQRKPELSFLHTLY